MKNFKCHTHDQAEYNCYQSFGKIYHLIKPPGEWRNNNLKLKQVRCLGCLCKNMDKQTDEIESCEFYSE